MGGGPEAPTEQFVAEQAGVELRLAEIRREIDRLVACALTEDEVKAALAQFDEVWGALAPGERANVLEILIQQVEWDAAAESVAITFNPVGLKTLQDQRQSEVAA
jgi:hypothetical protein